MRTPQVGALLLAVKCQDPRLFLRPHAINQALAGRSAVKQSALVRSYEEALVQGSWELVGRVKENKEQGPPHHNNNGGETSRTKVVRKKTKNGNKTARPAHILPPVGIAPIISAPIRLGLCPKPRS